MKTWILSFLLTILVLIISGCKAAHESPLETTQPLGGTLAQSTPASETMHDTNKDDEFQSFIETWKLIGLISEGLTMTAEDRSRFIEYFQEFDDVTQNYVILLLQGISTGTITVTDEYDNPENGVYLSHCQLCLYDMNRDGFPELILKTGVDSAGYWYTVYSVVNDELVDCGGFSGSHADLCADGFGSFIRYEAQMGFYDISVSTLEGTELITQKIASGELDYSKDEDYPELEAYGYGNYNQYLEFNGIPTLMLTPAG